MKNLNIKITHDVLEALKKLQDYYTKLNVAKYSQADVITLLIKQKIEEVEKFASK